MDQKTVDKTINKALDRFISIYHGVGHKYWEKQKAYLSAIKFIKKLVSTSDYDAPEEQEKLYIRRFKEETGYSLIYVVNTPPTSDSLIRNLRQKKYGAFAVDLDDIPSRSSEADIVLADGEMPLRDGLRLTEKIDSKVPLVVLIGDSRQKAVYPGAQVFVDKLEDLYGTIEGILLPGKS